MSGGQRVASSVAATLLSDAQLDQLRVYYGLDKPIVVSYVKWLGKVLRLDLGRSTRYNEPVWDIIKRRFPISIFFGVATLILTYAFAFRSVSVKAIRHRTLFDNVSSGFVFLGFAIPGYVVGIALLTLFASRLGWFPLGGFVSDDFNQSERRGVRFSTSCSTRSLPLLVVHGRQLRRHDVADEKLADGQSVRGLRAHRDRERPVVPSCRVRPRRSQQPHPDRDVVRQQHLADPHGLVPDRDASTTSTALACSATNRWSSTRLSRGAGHSRDLVAAVPLGNIVSDICVALVDPRVKFGT